MILDPRKVLTDEEHEDYVHLCGLTGRELEELPEAHCEECPRLPDCLWDHRLSETIPSSKASRTM